MVLQGVRVSSGAFLSCMTHALSTEHEEVMGLLIGETALDAAGQTVATVTSSLILQRSDRRADRVEVSPEQLAHASSYAETLADASGRKLHIVGWYHSHPHITVWPSHVDVRTQATYQMMDKGFFGLIFSTFSNDPQHAASLQLTCFQSDDSLQPIKVALAVDTVSLLDAEHLKMICELPRILQTEAQETFEDFMRSHGDASAAPLTIAHHNAVYTASLCRLMNTLSGPLLRSLEERVLLRERELVALKEEEAALRKRVQAEQQALRKQPKPSS